MLRNRRPLQRKKPLEARKPLPKLREKARRQEGRVTHGRIKARNVEPTAEQARFHATLRGISCQCGCGRPGECTHHILENVPGKTRKRDHWFVVRLAHYCHNLGLVSIHGEGSERKFRERTGCADLAAMSLVNRAKWRADNGR